MFGTFSINYPFNIESSNRILNVHESFAMETGWLFEFSIPKYLKYERFDSSNMKLYNHKMKFDNHFSIYSY